jgi:SEC-C motif-containing protein
MYNECCQRWHAGEAAPSAETLMRSRYSAYVLQLENYLRDTWDIDTRPATLDLQRDSVRWLGLKVVDSGVLDADAAFVEFVARFKTGGGAAQRLHERSRFVRRDGRWFYVDGEFNR